MGSILMFSMAQLCSSVICMLLFMLNLQLSVTEEDDNLENVASEAEQEENAEEKFSPPQLSEELERSLHMPANLACDARIAVAAQIETGLIEAHRHLELDKDLKLWDIIEVLENVCEYKSFEEYGLVTYKGKHRLRGPGLNPEVGQGAFSYMGGKWPTRLTMVCMEISGVFEDQERDLYNNWKSHENRKLAGFLCRNTNRTGLDKCLGQGQDAAAESTEKLADLSLDEEKLHSIDEL